MSTSTYVIDQAHGADDLDMVTAILSNVSPVYFEPPSRAATTIRIEAPTFWNGQSYYVGDQPPPHPAAAAHRNAGVLFRNIQIPEGEVLCSAKLRLYVTGWNPPDHTEFDPVDAWGDGGAWWPAENPYRVLIQAIKIASPSPFSLFPGPSFPGWGLDGYPTPGAPYLPTGNPGAGQEYVENVPTVLMSTYYRDFTYGQGGSSTIPFPPASGQGVGGYYPKAVTFSSIDLWSHPGRAQFQGGWGGLDIVPRLVRTDTYQLASVPDSEGYVEVDVTDMVTEILAFDYSTLARPWFSGMLSSGAGDPYWTPYGQSYPWMLSGPQQTVLASNGYVYLNVSPPQGIGSATCGSRPVSRPPFYSTVEPSGTTIGAVEIPETPVGPWWMCIAQAPVRPHWQSGDNLAFMLMPRRPADADLLGGNIMWLLDRYQGAVPGWREFASGDAGDSTKYPSLVITTGQPSFTATGLSAESLAGSPACHTKIGLMA